MVERIRVSIRGDSEVFRALRRLPDDGNDELRRTAGQLAQLIMRSARGFASSNKQARAAARTLNIVRDRFPTVEAGPEKRLAGSEFGITRRTGWYAKPRYWDSPLRQYRPHRGRASYWFFLAHERHIATVEAGWRDALNETVRKWSA